MTPDTPEALSGRERLTGLTLPGFANAHSHAFHRALRGVTQADRGTFWTWRERMYEVAAHLDPDVLPSSWPATVYAEMALAGISCVGEFHYLHHPAGRASPTRTRTRWAGALIPGGRRRGPAHHPARHVLAAHDPRVMLSTIFLANIGDNWRMTDIPRWTWGAA